MEKHTLTYYKWTDFKQLLCKELNITEEEFNTVNRSGLGTYEDMFEEYFRNDDDYIMPFDGLTYMGLEYKNAEEFIQEYQSIPYEIPLIKAVYKLIEEHKIEYIML